MLSPSIAESTGSPAREARRLRSGLVWTAALGTLLLGVALAVPDAREALDRARHATPGWIVLAVALELASCLGYVATVRLVLRRAPAREVRRLAWAEMAFGAVVPVGGAGGLAVGAWAMRAWGISWSRIANRSAVIFLLTTAINASVLALAGLGVSLGIGAHKSIEFGLVPAGVAIAGVAFFVLLPRVRSGRPATAQGWAGQTLDRMASWVRDTELTAVQADWRLLGAIGYLLFDIGVLWACLHAVGAAPPLLALVLGYQIGYLANLIPVPGGIGVLEGGLFGALVLYGLPPAPTAAAILLYHAIALWIPAIGGTVGFASLRRSVGGADTRLRAIPGDGAPAPVPVVVSDVAA